MHYSIESRERRYVKGYGLLSFAKKMGTHATRVAKNLNNKYGQKLADTAKKIFNRCIKNCKQKSNLKNSSSNWRFSNLIANKITSISKKNQQVNHTQMQLAMKYQKKDISPQERQKISDELRLI